MIHSIVLVCHLLPLFFSRLKEPAVLTVNRLIGVAFFTGDFYVARLKIFANHGLGPWLVAFGDCFENDFLFARYIDLVEDLGR